MTLNVATFGHLFSPAHNTINSAPLAPSSASQTPSSETPNYSGTAYQGGRRRHLVIGASAHSNALPKVAGMASALVQVASDDPSLSNGSLLTRDGQTIQHGESSEVVRALLMAGADRDSPQEILRAENPGDPEDFSFQPTEPNGLDPRYGAGYANIYNAYQSLVVGELDSVEDGGGTAGPDGWDYDPAFGGLNGSNNTATYRFAVNDPQRLFTTLSWHLQVDMDAQRLAAVNDNTDDLDGTATLYDLNLALFDVTDVETLLAESDSGGDSGTVSQSTETLMYELLPGRDYELRVMRADSQAAFEWDYGLAWRSESFVVPAPPPVLAGLVLLGCYAARVKRRIARGGSRC